MLDLVQEKRPKWRLKLLGRDAQTWDGEWYYHFVTSPYATIEWCEIAADQHSSVGNLLALLEPIGLVGEVLPDAIRIYGHVSNTAACSRLGIARSPASRK
jgi:hypothetical protein